MLSKLIFFLIIGFGMVNSQKPAQKNYTSISTTDGCRLYIGEIIFTKIDTSQGKSISTVAQVDGDNLWNDTTKEEPFCGNYNGTISLDYTDIKYTRGDEQKTALDSFTLTFNIEYQKRFGWWQVISLSVAANGDMTNNQELNMTWTRKIMESVAIGGATDFSYACSKPSALMYSDQDEKFIYKLELLNIQLQPFRYTKRVTNDKFTDNVDDCVAFFSAGVWMALLALLLFVMIILSGLVMLSNMTTVNRFDDPKSKALVIIAKD